MAELYNDCSCGQYSFDPYNDLSIHHEPTTKDFHQALKVMNVQKLVGKSTEEKRAILMKARKEWKQKNYNPSCCHSKQYRRNNIRPGKVYTALMTKYNIIIMAKRRHAKLADKEVKVITLDNNDSKVSESGVKQDEEEINMEEFIVKEKVDRDNLENFFKKAPTHNK